MIHHLLHHHQQAPTAADGDGDGITPAVGSNPHPDLCHKRRRRPAGTPDPDAEVVVLSPKTLMESDRYVCEICNQGFQRDQNLQMHRRRHKVPWKLLKRSSSSSTSAAEVCAKNSNDNAADHSSASAMTPPRKRVYVCPEPTCLHHDPSHALGDLVGIKKHYRRKHSRVKQWECDKCDKAYAVQSDYKAHLKTCGTRGHCCDCGRVFSRVESFIEHQDTCCHAGHTSAKSGATSGPPPPSSAQNALLTIMNNNSNSKGNTRNNQLNSSSKSNDYRSIYIAAATNNSNSNNNSAAPVNNGVGIMASFDLELQQLLSPPSATYSASITMATARNRNSNSNSNSNAINITRTQVSHNHSNKNHLLDLDLNHNHLEEHHHHNNSHINIPSHHAYQPHINVKSSSPSHYNNVHVDNDHGATTLDSHSNAIHGPKTENNKGSMIVAKSDVSNRSRHHHNIHDPFINDQSKAVERNHNVNMIGISHGVVIHSSQERGTEQLFVPGGGGLLPITSPALLDLSIGLFKSNEEEEEDQKALFSKNPAGNGVRRYGGGLKELDASGEEEEEEEEQKSRKRNGEANLMMKKKKKTKKKKEEEEEEEEEEEDGDILEEEEEEEEEEGAERLMREAEEEMRKARSERAEAERAWGEARQEVERAMKMKETYAHLLHRVHHYYHYYLAEEEREKEEGHQQHATALYSDTHLHTTIAADGSHDAVALRSSSSSNTLLLLRCPTCNQPRGQQMMAHTRRGQP